jgi:quercetin dioxygenase-like cupin family protein
VLFKKSLQVLVFGALISIAQVQAQEPTNPAAANLRSHIMMTPEELKWENCPAALPPGAQCAVLEGDPETQDRLFALRVKIPDGYKIAPHYHPADEHLVVISGTFHIGLGDNPNGAQTQGLTAGSFAVMPKGTQHFARAEGETILQVYAIGPWNIIYVNPKDDPRNQK